MSSWTAGRGYWNYANRVRSGSCPGGTMSKKKKKKKNERRARKKTTRGRIRRSTGSTTSRRRRRRRSTYSRRRRREGKKATYITKRRRLAPLWLLYPKGHNVSPHGAASHADPTTEPHSHPTSYVPLDAATGCTNLSTCPSCSPYTRIYNPPLSLPSTLPSRVESSREPGPRLGDYQRRVYEGEGSQKRLGVRKVLDGAMRSCTVILGAIVWRIMRDLVDILIPDENVKRFY